MIIYNNVLYSMVKILNESDYLELSFKSVCESLCWRTTMRSAVSVFYFLVLQVLWIFRSLYEAVMPERNSNNDSFTQTTETNSQETDTEPNKRRHLIHLFTTTPKEQNGRPVCYMHVCEIITPHEEEMLRCACAKGASTNTLLNNNNEQFPPTSRISRATFTNAWMESFSLVM